MVARAALVPIAKRFPFFAVVTRTENLAFGRQNKIGTHRKFEIGQAGFEQIDRTAGVNREKNAAVLQIADQLHAGLVQDWFTLARDERAVEIDTEKFDFHVDLTMIRLRVRARAGAGVEMKSAYELAME